MERRSRAGKAGLAMVGGGAHPRHQPLGGGDGRRLRGWSTAATTCEPAPPSAGGKITCDTT